MSPTSEFLSDRWSTLEDSATEPRARWTAYHEINKFGTDHDKYMLSQVLPRIDLPLKQGRVKTRVLRYDGSEAAIEDFSFWVLQNSELTLQEPGGEKEMLQVVKVNTDFDPEGFPKFVEVFTVPSTEVRASAFRVQGSN